MLWLRRFAALTVTLWLAAVINPNHESTWCDAVRSVLHSEASEQEALDRAAIEAHPVCIGSRVWSAGRLADTVLYEYRRNGDYLTVGYFAYWSTERPWGDNVLTYGFLPALIVDAIYSHTLFLLPGARDALYGPGDIEGASVTYRQEPSGELVPIGGLADDDGHDPVQLSAADLDGGGRTTLITDVWSHQLGGKGGAHHAKLKEESRQLRCFSGETLRPLSDVVARTFRLGSHHAPRRAKPAWSLDGIHESQPALASREPEPEL